MTERMRLATATLLVVGLGVGFWNVTSMPEARGKIGEGEIETAQAAVNAWASFASTGDIEFVSPWFAADGPQYAQLQVEVAKIVPGGVYHFALSGARVVGPGLVRGSVTVTSESGETQRYRWDIELVQQGRTWKVWTVRTSPDQPET